MDWRKILTLFRAPEMDPPVSLQFHATTPATTKAAERIPAAQRPSFRVVLGRWLSNPSSPLKRALRAYRKLELTPATCIFRAHNPVGRAKWLNATQLTQLVAGYQAGATVYELADQFGVHRGTIARRLKAQGVELRCRSINEAEIARAIELYATGLSTAKVGAKLGRDHSTIWHALRAAGVQLRDTHGR